jgi:hypothetical protein
VKRDRRIELRVSDTEVEWLAEVSGERGMTPHQWLRFVLGREWFALRKRKNAAKAAPPDPTPPEPEAA